MIVDPMTGLIEGAHRLPILEEHFLMYEEELSDFLGRLLVAHGVDAAKHDGWLLADDRLPAMRGEWFASDTHESLGQLDISVALPDGRVIKECFVGFGEGLGGCKDALQTFVQGCFHVLLGALWDSADEDRLNLEPWTISSRRWNAYFSNFTTRVVGDEDLSLPPDAFDAVETALKSENLDPGPHWVRTFYCNLGKYEHCIEALLDNEDWTAGSRALSKVAWPKRKDYYSVRNFLMLVDAKSQMPQAKPH